MPKYLVKTINQDFIFLQGQINSKGTRKKKLVYDLKEKQYAFFKYQGDGYIVSEACSEKMSYEIANILGYPCAKIEFAKDEDGILGVLNQLFVGNTNDGREHVDAIVYLKGKYKERNEYYTIDNIKSTLDKLNESLFNDFIKIMIFDALVGEQDRHEENWGISIIQGKYKMSPLYDNGCNLLREFKDENYAQKYYSEKKDFNAYIKNSKTYIYKNNEKKRFKHFELIEFLYSCYSEVVKQELDNLNKLTNDIISEIVESIPDDLMTLEHKEFIKKYLKKRRDILLKIGGD